MRKYQVVQRLSRDVLEAIRDFDLVTATRDSMIKNICLQAHNDGLDLATAVFRHEKAYLRSNPEWREYVEREDDQRRIHEPYWIATSADDEEWEQLELRSIALVREP